MVTPSRRRWQSARAGGHEARVRDLALSRRQVLGAAAVGTVAWAAPSIWSTAAAQPGSCAPCADGGRNYIPNPSAESVVFGTDPSYDPVLGTGTAPGGIPQEWTTSTGFRVLSYATAALNGEYPSTAPSGGGLNLFSGPIDSDDDVSTATTDEIVLDCQTEIAAGSVSYLLSGYFAAIDGDTIDLQVAFLDSGGSTVATESTGPITTATTTFQFVSVPAAPTMVPTAAARVVFTLTATKAVGNTTLYNHGCADLLSFTLC